MTTAGDVNTQVGMARHIYLITKSMEDTYFYSADSELLVISQEGRLRFATELGVIEITDDPAFDVPYWNDVMEMGPKAWAMLSARLQELLADGASEQAAVAPHLIPMEDARMELPLVVAGFTDFYAGKHHTTNVGTMFRGADNALPPNWLPSRRL